MAVRFLLDTNILSDLVRHPHGSVARRLTDVGEAAICTSIIVACEMRYGAAKKNADTLSERIDALLNAIEVVPFEEEADRHYAIVRQELTRAGRLIGPNDLSIAAHALALNLTLVSANIDEFSRVPDLVVESWL
ncbi:MAG: type II toxin-antitoxin system VapC family toxin [Gammaproteobacteria bacterium]